MATVSEPGPFSAFPGIDRVLGIVEGEGLRLFIEGEIRTVTSKSPAVAFPGDVTVASDLLGGPVADFNLMTRRGQYVGRIDRVRGDERAGFHTQSHVTLLVALSQCEVLGAGSSVSLGRLNAVVLDVGEGEVIATSPSGLDLFVVAVFDKGQATH